MTRTRRPFTWGALVVVALLVAGAITPPTVRGQAGTSVITVDAGHGLTDRAAIDRYEDREVATTALTVPDLRLTVAESHDDVGLEGYRMDMDKRYLRIQYNETLSKTIRVFIPAEYWYPVTSEGQQGINADVAADFEPTTSGRYTAVTVQFDGQTDAVWAIPKAASFVFWGRSQSRKVIENRTGFEPPTLGANGTWRYVPDGQLDGEASYPINVTDGSLTIQYDSAREGPAGDPTWLAVPECDGGPAPVCQYEKAGIDDRVFILSTTTDPPPVRFKRGTDLRASGSSIINDLRLIPDRIMGDLSGLFDVEWGGS